MTSLWSLATLSFSTSVLLFLFIHLPDPCSSASETETTLDLASLTIGNKRLNEEPFVEFAPRGLIWCVKECKRRSGKCSSFNFLRPALTCQLNVGSQSTTQLTSDDNSLYSNSSSWPDTMLGPCDNATCSATERCQVNGDNVAVCVPSECSGDPPSVARAAISVTSRAVGRSFSYTCNSGYILVGQATTFCTTLGQWTSTSFTCRDCGDPPSVQYATPTGSSRTAGSTMTYSCNGRPVENGPAQVVCDSNGYWASPTFTCIGFRTAVRGNSGTVVSPGYPGSYSNDQSYTITITLDSYGPQTVYVSGSYNLETSSDGCFDYIIINGDGIKLCGSTTFSKSTYVAGQTWTIYFHTDHSIVYDRGFLVNYSK